MGCDYVNPTPLTVARTSTLEWVRPCLIRCSTVSHGLYDSTVTNAGGMPFYFDLEKLLSVGIPLDYLLDDGNAPYYSDYSYGYESYYDSDYNLPDPPGAPMPGTPAAPGSGPSSPTSGGETTVEVVVVSLMFADIFTYMDRDSDELYGFVDNVQTAVAFFAGAIS
eukprot:scaffold654089_cov57-Prasinocladus_malaysianus.AAC.1